MMKRAGRFILHFGLYGAVATLCLFVTTPWLARWGMVLDQLVSFQLQFLVVGVCVLALTMALRRWRLSAFTLLLCLIFATRIAMMVPAAAHAGSVAAELKILSSNLLCVNRTAEPFLAWVKEKNPDVVVIQEYGEQLAPTIEKILASSYPYIYTASSSDPQGMAIFSRFPCTPVPVTEQTLKVHQISRTFAQGILRYRVDVGGGVMVYNVHPVVAAGERLFETRNSQFVLLAELVNAETLPVVVAGDLNATPWSPFYADLLRNAHLTSARDGHGLLPTWPQAYRPITTYVPEFARDACRIPIDYILGSPRVTFSEFVRGPSVGSDHFPLFASVQIPESPPR